MQACLCGAPRAPTCVHVGVETSGLVFRSLQLYAEARVHATKCLGRVPEHRKMLGHHWWPASVCRQGESAVLKAPCFHHVPICHQLPWARWCHAGLRVALSWCFLDSTLEGLGIRGLRSGRDGGGNSDLCPPRSHQIGRSGIAFGFACNVGASGRWGRGPGVPLGSLEGLLRSRPSYGGRAAWSLVPKSALMARTWTSPCSICEEFSLAPRSYLRGSLGSCAPARAKEGKEFTSSLRRLPPAFFPVARMPVRFYSRMGAPGTGPRPVHCSMQALAGVCRWVVEPRGAMEAELWEASGMLAGRGGLED